MTGLAPIEESVAVPGVLVVPTTILPKLKLVGDTARPRARAMGLTSEVLPRFTSVAVAVM